MGTRRRIIGLSFFVGITVGAVVGSLTGDLQTWVVVGTVLGLLIGVVLGSRAVAENGDAQPDTPRSDASED